MQQRCKVMTTDPRISNHLRPSGEVDTSEKRAFECNNSRDTRKESPLKKQIRRSFPQAGTLARRGFKTLRFKNQEVLRNLDGVLRTLEEELKRRQV